MPVISNFTFPGTTSVSNATIVNRFSIHKWYHVIVIGGGQIHVMLNMRDSLGVAAWRKYSCRNCPRVRFARYWCVGGNAVSKRV